jgi:hypothetical protein
MQLFSSPKNRIMRGPGVHCTETPNKVKQIIILKILV